jgi:hypothetical protein
MATIGFIASTVVMGLLVVGVAALLARGRSWRRRAAMSTAGAFTTGGSGESNVVSRAAESPTAWMASFLLLALAFGGGAVLFASGASLPAGSQATVGLVLAAVAAVIVGFFFTHGLYRSAKGWGLPTSGAVAVSAWGLGVLVVVVVAVKLLLAG